MQPIRLIILLLFLGSLATSLLAQSNHVQFKVYSFEDGLSHRNVIKIQQDTSGYMWIATVNGLNRFDGYEFIHFHSQSETHSIPKDFIPDMNISRDNRIWLSHPNSISILQPQTGTTQTISIERDRNTNLQNWTAHNLIEDHKGSMWFSTLENNSGDTYLQAVDATGQLADILKLENKQTKSPIVQLGQHYWAGMNDNELWQLTERGQVLQRFAITRSISSLSHIVDIKVDDAQTFWVLLNNGQVYFKTKKETDFQIHPISKTTTNQGEANALLIEDKGDVWIGGRGLLYHYEAASSKTFNYHPSIEEIIKNNCSYRQLFLDNTGIVWAASDFGAIKIVRSDELFSKYLSGGSEYCNNGFCSIRGITEDPKGNIYFSYYNSIHFLDAKETTIYPLFPTHNYFNYPFGITYYKNALWTGNGKRISLPNLQVDTMFSHPSEDLGATMIDRDSILWIGYKRWLYQYDEETKRLKQHPISSVLSDLNADISFLYQGKTDGYVWISTMNDGCLKIDSTGQLIAHYSTDDTSKSILYHPRVNCTYEDNDGYLWMATGNGLHQLHIVSDSLKVYSEATGNLPNNYINGLLSEGDSCIWLSTDNGLCRFNLASKECHNFYKRDGLSENEFNRISFFKASDGRLFFGGLNGVNAFYPGEQFLRNEMEQESQLLWTGFSKFDGRLDTLIQYYEQLTNGQQIELAYQDKFFTFEFALANYHNAAENLYSYRLKGYEEEWSKASTINSVRYHNIPAGNYTFQVRAAVGKNNWGEQELSIPVHIHLAFYKHWWFLFLLSSIVLLGVYSFAQYRLFWVRKRKEELEKEVLTRTQQLEQEKLKSDELLLNILPAETAEELKKYGKAKAKRHEQVTVMFVDFKDFSRISENMDPEQLVAEIDFCFRNFDAIIDRFQLEKIKTIGDAYMCAGGISEDNPQAMTAVIHAALEIQDFMESLKTLEETKDNTHFQARIGIHTGPIVAGVVGTKKFAYDIWGNTVNIAARMESHGYPGKVNISEETYAYVKNKFTCAPHGQFITRQDTVIEMYFVE